MTTNNHTSKLTGIVSIISGFMAFLCMLLALISVNYNSDAIANPSLILTTPGVSPTVAKWSMLCDMFGYYLLLLPAIFYFYQWMKPRTQWAVTITSFGFIYVLVGCIGAAILSVIYPTIIMQYITATGVEQLILQSNFNLVNTIVYGGMWNTLEVLLGGAWWLCIGVLLRKEYKTFGWITIILGTATLADGTFNMFEVKSLAEIGLNIYLILGIVWPIWLGILLLKDRLRVTAL